MYSKEIDLLLCKRSRQLSSPRHFCNHSTMSSYQMENLSNMLPIVEGFNFVDFNFNFNFKAHPNTPCSPLWIWGRINVLLTTLKPQNHSKFNIEGTQNTKAGQEKPDESAEDCAWKTWKRLTVIALMESLAAIPSNLVSGKETFGVPLVFCPTTFALVAPVVGTRPF